MPRPRRIHSPKTKRVPLAYQLNDELAAVAAILHAKFDVHFASLASFKIGYVLISGGTLPKRGKKVSNNGVGRPPSIPIGKAAIPPEPVIRNGKEVWLCTRCPETFMTSEALKRHLMKGHPPVGAAPTRPFGEQPVMEHQSGGGLLRVSEAAA